MVDSTEHLIPTNALKTNVLSRIAAEHSLRQPYIKYDADFDAVRILVVAPENVDIVVHYVDDYVGLLYRADDLEIVGIQIEAFEHSFVPQYEGVQRVWRLSDMDKMKNIEDLGDMLFNVERIQRQLAQEVAKATQATLGKPGSELTAVLSPD
ncbi:MAG: hypothetical protein D6737_17505 [Chloroflexi bacterium]|nr:MAG: hypothetical protein CUN54_08850 [Phototrophicales bacterium]RMF77504.1 MAG: hypothetical protein D6737_17505 [Chloroflexota bacterium]